MYDTDITTEILVENFLYKLCQKDIGIPRLVQGRSWWIEEFSGAPLNQNEFDIEKVTELLVKIHSMETDWFDQYRTDIKEKFPILKNAPNSSVVWCIPGDNDTYAILYNKRYINWLLENEVDYITEPAKKVVTLHGDFHTANLLIKPDGSHITLDLEFCWVSCLVYDIVYFCNLNRLSRAKIFEFVEAYLKHAGYEATKELTRDFVFDIETGRIFTRN